METFSTQGIPIAKRLAFWNEVASDAFATMEVRARDAERFYGRLDRKRLGPLTLLTVYSAAVRIRHTRAHIARMPESSYLLLAPLQRDMELIPQGCDPIRLRAGEFCLLDRVAIQADHRRRPDDAGR